MSARVKLSQDGSSIEFTQSDTITTTAKKFRKSPEIEGFYRFIYENDLLKESYELLCDVIIQRMTDKAEKKAAAKK